MEPSDEGADTGTFFKKYSPRQSSDPSADNKFFRKYGLAQSEDAGHPDEQPEPARLELAANAETRVPDSPSRIARRPFAFTRLRLYSALTVAALLLGVLYTSRQHSSPTSESPSQTLEDRASGPDSQPGQALPAVEPDDAVSLAKRSRNALSQPKRFNNASFRAWLITSMAARARSLEDRGMLIEAANLYQTILSEFPDDRSSKIALDRIENMLSTQQRDKDARAAREAGLRKFRMGDYPGAEADLAIAVNSGLTDTAALYALGMSYLRLGDHSKASATLNDCLAASPDYAPALVGLAQAEMVNGDRQQALSLLNRALQLGGGAEFTPAKIKDLIASLNSGNPALPKQQR